MTNSAFGDAAAKRKITERHAGVTREVADLVRHCSNIDGRHGFRIIAKGVSGHIFFERGRVVHAEFGEDCGLRAVVEMLRAGPVQLEPTSSWPSQPRLHLGPELLLSLSGGDASRVVRKVDLPMGPPPLPDPELADPEMAEPAELVAPVRSEASRGGSKRAISGVMPRLVNQANEDPANLDQANFDLAHVELAGRASTEVLAPPSSASEPGTHAGALLASRRAAAIAASRLAASVAVSERAMVRATGQTSPPPPAVRPQSAVTAAIGRTAVSPTAVSPTAVSPTEASPAARVRPKSTALPITRARTARSRSIVAPSASSTRPSESAGPTRRSPKLKRDPAGLAPPPVGASKSPIVVSPGGPTTMVRIAVRGDLLAARGKNAEQLAEAAAFIHGVANLIAADFGRHGRANVHLSGKGSSLLVARSEVNDIAAALGPTERLTSLLGKVGFK
jgi:hypothetical protein